MPPFTSWSSIASHLKFEVVQAGYEGKIVPEDLRNEVQSLDDEADLFEDDKAGELFAALKNLEDDPGFAYEQPDDLDAIRRLRPNGPRRLPMHLSEDELLDRLHGAWTGRACGCALGKPVEGMCLIHQGRLRVKAYLQNRGQWPLEDYFSGIPREDDAHRLNPADPAVRENIRFMPPDDDIHYTLMGLHVLERFGAGFRWHNVADAWNRCLPFSAICTAESQAITNYNIRNVRHSKGTYPSPHWTARHNNPYREWIGAQIRADGWAYGAAGHPERAAEFAWRDAHWTHTANGIYGAMFMAAMIAASYVVHEPAELVEIGLSEIPAGCKLAEAVRQARAWVDECGDFEAFMEKLEARYGDLHPVHTVNNAMVCVMSLFYGAMDTERAVCTAVMAGLDTDCNGATVGSIVGASSGYREYSQKFKAPLSDTIRPTMFGFETVRMADLARRTQEVHRKCAS
jgi:hypothetical protein